MTGNKKQKKISKLRQVQQNLDGLLKISEASRISIPIENVYQYILDVVMEVVDYSHGGIHLVEPNGRFAYLVASRAIPETVLPFVEIEDFDKDFMRPLMELKEPLWYSDINQGANDHPESAKVLGYKSLMKIPLLAGENLIGVLTLSKKDPYEWTEDEVHWLAAVGRYLGILIDHIRMTKIIQEHSVIQERERISQELHDNFSQYIGTILLLTARVVDKIDSGDIVDIRNDMESIEQISRKAYSSLRDEMYGLRLIHGPEQDLVSTIRDYLDQFQLQWSLEQDFEIENLREPYFTSPIITIQLLRILQESLTNIIRHARATQVKVSLKEADHLIFLEISDNGIGFNPDADFENRFGLRIIRERAASLGGRVIISQATPSGTFVHVEIPKVVTKIDV